MENINTSTVAEIVSDTLNALGGDNFSEVERAQLSEELTKVFGKLALDFMFTKISVSDQQKTLQGLNDDKSRDVVMQDLVIQMQAYATDIKTYIVPFQLQIISTARQLNQAI